MAYSYMPMNQIIPGLWLGNIHAALDWKTLQANNISCILSICDYNPLEQQGALDKFPVEQFQQMYICAMDEFEQDLLEHFDKCFQFISNGLEGGKGVLVHCQVGVSRSATVTIAYLMNKHGLSVNDACRKVSSARPMISPNPGFMCQLNLLETMGGRVDRSHPRYRQYRLAVFARSAASPSGDGPSAPPATDRIPCVADPQQQQQQNSATTQQEAASAASADAVYRCRKCRRALFRTGCLLTHPTYQPKGQVSGVSVPECSRELFVEPVEWMRSEVGATVTGKLACPKCSAKVGSFTWVGERCSCGQFVCPAFHLRAQAVDAPPTGAAAAAVVLPSVAAQSA